MAIAALILAVLVPRDGFYMRTGGEKWFAVVLFRAKLSWISVEARGRRVVRISLETIVATCRDWGAELDGGKPGYPKKPPLPQVTVRYGSWLILLGAGNKRRVKKETKSPDGLFSQSPRGCLTEGKEKQDWRLALPCLSQQRRPWTARVTEGERKEKAEVGGKGDGVSGEW